MTAEEAANRAKSVLLGYGELGGEESDVDEHEAIGSSLGAAVSSFIFFASGAIIPVLPYIFGMTGLSAVLVASVLVGIALLLTGTVVGLLSGTSLMTRALRQLMIGWGAAAATYLLGLLFGTSLS